MRNILTIDQGTTSSRAIVFDHAMRTLAVAQEEFAQHYPSPGWVEHNPEDIWQSVLSTCHAALKKANITGENIAAVAITNQRETTVLWDRHSGMPLGPAVVWQDRRTNMICAQLREKGHEGTVQQKTGLLLDPYFSATKIAWLLDQHPDARDRAARGDLLFGTVDSYLIWRLTNGRAHVTDATNAARTLLFDIHKGQWCSELCDIFDVPMEMLPRVLDCAADFGQVDAAYFGTELPICGVAGDQQAAAIGQACFQPGMVKSTYGTGCFTLLNTGDRPIASSNRLLTTLAYQLDGQRTYALEGSIFVAGAVVQWLRDGLQVINHASEAETNAASADPTQEVMIVPAFTGLGAPYWLAECRGVVFGLTRNSGPAEFCKAALQSVGFQTRDLIEAMAQDWSALGTQAVLRVDGGMAASDWTMQFLADILDAPVDRPRNLETTALGAAWLAGHFAGLYPDQAGFAKDWSAHRQFTPNMPKETREAYYTRWKAAIEAIQAY